MKKLTLKIFWILLILCIGASPLLGQALILNPLEGSVTTLHHVAVTIMGKPGANSKLYVNEELVSEGTIRVDGVYDFLNVDVPDGPVKFRIEAVGARDKVFTSERSIHVMGPPKTMVPYQERIEIPADGHSMDTLSFEFRDEWGYLLDHLKVASINLTHGKVALEDMDKVSAGVQLPLINGELKFPVKAPKEAVKAILEVSVMGEYFQMPIRYTTPQGDFIFVGSVNGAVSNFQDFPDNENEPDVETWRENVIGNDLALYGGRVAFYARGNVFDKYQLTASYDSKRNYKDQFYQDIDPSEQYAVYGDASNLEYDAQSNSELFVKLEQNESAIMYGDYDTQLDEAEFTAYNRTFNGLLADLNYKDHSVRAFGTFTDREMQLDEIRGEGVSGYYFLTQTYITDLSEKVEIQTRDKYHSEIVVRSKEQNRYQDYTINYEDGSLMFKQPVSSMDEDGNPVYIVVSYEYKSGKRETAIGGVRYDGKLFNKLNLGAMFVAEEKQVSNYYLYGVDAMMPITKWLSVKGEYAESITPEMDGDKTRGNAYKAELLFNPMKFFNISAYYRTIDTSFTNTSMTGSSSESGSRKYGFRLKMGNEKFGQLQSEYYNQLNKIATVNENAANVFNVTYKQTFLKNGNVNVAYEDATKNTLEEDSIKTLRSQLIKGSIDYKLGKKFKATVEREQNLGKTDQSKPTFTGIGLTYDISDKVGIFVKYKRVENQENPNQYIVGVDSKVSENTELSGKYEIGGTSSDERNRATIGLKNMWMIGESLTFNIAYENVSMSDNFTLPTVDHQPLSTSREFVPDMPLKMTVKAELLAKSDSRQWNTMFNVDFKLARGLSFLGKSTYTQTTYLEAFDDYVVKSDNQIGLAIRPERSDYFNSLLKVAYLLDKNTHVATKTNYERFIVYSHNYWQPSEKLEAGFSFAYRMVIDEEILQFEDIVTTSFFALRLEYDLSLKWYAAADVRFVNIKELKQHKLASSVEVGYNLIRNMQVGLGYALSTFEDPDFASQNFLYNNFYLTFHMKFSEDVFNW